MKKTLARIWDNLEDYLCCAFLTIIMTLLMTQVLYRYIGGRTIAWSEEVSRFVFLYLVYFAASLATHKNLHIRVTAHIKYLPRMMQAGLLLLTDIIWFLSCAIIISVGYDFLVEMGERPMLSGALMLDMRYVFIAIPLAFTLQAIRILERWWRIFTKRDKLVVPSEEVF